MNNYVLRIHNSATIQALLRHLRLSKSANEIHHMRRLILAMRKLLQDKEDKFYQDFDDVCL